ncbi:MAG: hypothetical protein ACI9UA_003710 [Pseudoalteromonas tetraodonis]|jgi:hypothetical protein
MLEPITISEGRPSAIRTLLRKAIGRLNAKHNFVRPMSQPLDPEFPCPCCAKTITIPASQAGQKGRCRHCYMPIRNAAPNRNKPAADLSRDFDPIARPKDYPLTGHQTTVTDYIPRSALAALPLMTLIVVGLGLLTLLPKTEAGVGLVAATMGPTPIELITSPAIEAEQLVSNFLALPDWTEGVAHVHDGLNVASEIAALSEHLPNGGFATSSKLNDDGTSTVRVNFHDGTLAHFQVANIDGEDLIIWDANPHGLPIDINSRMVGMPEMEPK